MAQLPQAFDANNFDPTQSAGMLPIGKHKVVVDSSELKETTAKDGGYLQLNLKVIEGPQAGATGPYRLNLYNKSTQAVDIANKQFSAVCHVTGVFVVQDSSMLHNKPFMVEVGLQKPDPSKPEVKYTEVKKVFDVAGNEPGKAAQAPAAVQQPAATTPAFAQPNAVPPIAQQPAATAPAWGAQPAATVPGGQPPLGVQSAASPVAPAWGQPQA